MLNERPVNLNLLTLKFPIPAIASILHRISGVVLFLSIPILLCLLGSSLRSPSSFDELKVSLNSPFPKVVLLIILASLFFHLFAGFRHMVMDLGFAESFRAGRLTSWFVIILSLAATIGATLWLW